MPINLEVVPVGPWQAQIKLRGKLGYFPQKNRAGRPRKLSGAQRVHLEQGTGFLFDHNLPDVVLAVIGLYWHGYNDVDELVALANLREEDVVLILASGHSVVCEALVEGVTPGVVGSLGSPIRCGECSGRITLVPCVKCRGEGKYERGDKGRPTAPDVEAPKQPPERSDPGSGGDAQGDSEPAPINMDNSGFPPPGSLGSPREDMLNMLQSAKAIRVLSDPGPTKEASGADREAPKGSTAEDAKPKPKGLRQRLAEAAVAAFHGGGDDAR